MRRYIVLLLGLFLSASYSIAQESVLSDVMSGKLVNPEVGVWAWYSVKDTASGQTVFMRQAIVGEKKVDNEQGYWFETEVVPQVGFPTVYKMLLTGPASDPKNIHQIILRDGDRKAEEIPVEQGASTGSGLDKGNRTVVGKETVNTPQGPVEAEHVIIESDGQKTELWTSDKVKPMGIVRLLAAEGEMALQRFGKGGSDGESSADKKISPPDSPNGTKVTVKVSEKEKPTEGSPPQPNTADVSKPEAKAESAPEPETVKPPAVKAADKKRNFSGKKDGK